MCEKVYRSSTESMHDWHFITNARGGKLLCSNGSADHQSRSTCGSELATTHPVPVPLDNYERRSIEVDNGDAITVRALYTPAVTAGVVA